MTKERAEIKEITKTIVKKYKPEKIILFGSFAWGKPGPDSDVDLLVIKDTNNARLLARQIDGSIPRKSLPIDVLVYTPEEAERSVNEYKNLFIEDILRNGKILYSKTRNKPVIFLPKRPLKILH